MAIQYLESVVAKLVSNPTILECKFLPLIFLSVGGDVYLIQPYWNVNQGIAVGVENEMPYLIQPYWNVNIVKYNATQLPPFVSNPTILECKFPVKVLFFKVGAGI